MANDITIDSSSFQPLQASAVNPPATPATNPQLPPVSIDSSSFTPLTPSQSQGALGTVENAANKLGEFAAGVVPGAIEGAGQTIQSLPYIGKKIISPEAMAAERSYFAPGSKAEAAGQVGGGVGEGVLEFVLGDEALKGLSIADKIGIASKIEKVAKESPYIGALLRHGVTAARNGTVGTAEALAKGATLPEALKSGAETGLISGTLGAAGELAETAPTTTERAAARTAQTGTAAAVAGTGANQALGPKKPGETDQEELERRISGAVQGFMGAESLADSAPKIRQAAQDILENRQNVGAEKIANQDAISARKDIKMAIPSTKSTPYEPHDMDVADAYNESHHENVEPIRSVKDLVDATDQSIKGIENQIAEHIKIIPNEPITTDVLGDVRDKLMQNERGTEFANAGMKEVKGLNLDNITVERADSVRRQLNAENSAILKKNNYDLADARASDPGFAAREAAAESLRSGIYDQLENHNIQGARELRLDEGSLIKVRDAAQAQLQNAEKIVKNSSPTSLTRQIAAKTVKGAGALVGAGTGAAVAGPVGAVGGAAAGGALGEIAANKIASPDISRDELVERRFGKKVATYEPAQMSVPGGIAVPPEKQPAVGTQGTLPESTKTPVAAPGTVEQGKLFGTESPYPRYAAQQSPQVELLSLRQSIAPLKAILDDPMASQADKVDAAQKLAALPLAGLQNPTVKPAGPEARSAAKIELPYEVPKEKLLQTPSKDLNASQILGHEWGHALVAHKEGFGVDEIKSHLNPDLMSPQSGGKVNASTVLDLSSLGVGPDGQIPQSNFNAAIDRILTTVMGGAAADFVHSGTSLEDNTGTAGDLAYARRILKKAGYTPEEAEAKINAAFDRATNHLTDQHAMDIMKENRDVREPGLSKTLHVSSDRMQKVLNELDRRQNAENKGNKGNDGNKRDNRGFEANNGEHDQHDVTGREDNAEKEPRQQIANETGKTIAGLKEKTTGDDQIDAHIKAAGAIPAGKMMNLILFHDPETGSTLALDRTEATSPETIKQHMDQSRAKFGIKTLSQTERERVLGVISPEHPFARAIRESNRITNAVPETSQKSGLTPEKLSAIKSILDTVGNPIKGE